MSLPMMKLRVKSRCLSGVVFCIVALAAPAGLSADGDPCEVAKQAAAIRLMSRDERAARRRELMQGTPAEVVDALCESSTSLTLDGYRQQLDRAERQNRDAGGADFDPAEFYFFLVCGEDQVNLSPLAYHAFNLNRDEHGFLGGVPLAIVWMAIGYLDTADPDHERSFMDIIQRVLAYARKEESQTEIDMYEDLLEQVSGFREDYPMIIEQCDD